MKNASEDNLRQAIGRRAVALLSLPSGGALSHHNTRLLVAEAGGFWIQAAPGAAGAIDALVAAAEPVGVSFRAGESKIVCTTVIQRAGAPADDQGNALLMAWPARLAFVQHRADRRVCVPPGADVPLRVWLLPADHDSPERLPAAGEWPATLRDLGLGGMGFLAQLPGGDRVEAAPGQRLRILLGGGETGLTLEGTIRTARRQSAGATRVSVRFEHLDEDLALQQALAAFAQAVAQLEPGGGVRPGPLLRSA